MRNPIAKKYQGQFTGLVLDTAALAKYDDIIDLSIGDTDYITDERIIERAYQDAKAGYTHYGDPKGDPELVTAIADAWAEDWGQALSKDEIMVTASSGLGMALALMAILDPGDEVIVFSPYFSPYKQQIELAGGVAVDVPTRAEEQYAIDEARLEAAITSRTKAIIFNNPTNPTGAGYGSDTYDTLTKIATRHDLLILADEIYTTYLYDGTFQPLRLWPGMKERTITLNSFSKNYLMTGWRIGTLIATPEIIRVVLRINGALIYTAPALSQRAAIEALQIRQDIKDTYITQYKERVMYAADRIDQIPYFDLVRPQGTFYLFPSIQRTGMDAKSFCAYALEHAHVLLSPGDVFGDAGKGHVRMACTVGRDQLETAFNRLATLTF